MERETKYVRLLYDHANRREAIKPPGRNLTVESLVNLSCKKIEDGIQGGWTRAPMLHTAQLYHSLLGSQTDLVLVDEGRGNCWSAKFRPVGSTSSPAFQSFASLDARRRSWRIETETNYLLIGGVVSRITFVSGMRSAFHC